MDTDLKHKILFFFMPKNIVFTNSENQDPPAVSMLKSVSPCFYWCSGHEFITTETDKKYLIQYQIYFVNGNQIEPCQIVQNWYKSKNDIRKNIFDFLEMWKNNHEKILLTPENKRYNALSDNQIESFSQKTNIYNFSDFAEFVGKSIFSLKENYILEAKELNFDYVQKEFWRFVALDSEASLDIKKYLNLEKINNKKTKSVKANARQKPKKTKNRNT